LSKAAELISAHWHSCATWSSAASSRSPKALGVLEEPGLFRGVHARLDPLDQRLLLLGDEAADVDAREAWNLQRPKVQPGRHDAGAEQQRQGAGKRRCSEWTHDSSALP
jgi:hypothetical protein